VAICITIYAIYIAVYRFILNRLPILYGWKTADETVPVIEPARAYASQDRPAPAAAGTYRSRVEEAIPANSCNTMVE
jgi:hypothetical protein